MIAALDFWADQLTPDGSDPENDPGKKGTLNITFKWDDSIIIDRMTEMAQWQHEITLGLRSKVEYRMHFYGEDQATAAAAVAAAQQENMPTDILQGVLGNGNTQQQPGKNTGSGNQAGTTSKSGAGNAKHGA